VIFPLPLATVWWEVVVITGLLNAALAGLGYLLVRVLIAVVRPHRHQTGEQYEHAHGVTRKLMRRGTPGLEGHQATRFAMVQPRPIDPFQQSLGRLRYFSEPTLWVSETHLVIEQGPLRRAVVELSVISGLSAGFTTDYYGSLGAQYTVPLWPSYLRPEERIAVRVALREPREVLVGESTPVLAQAILVQVVELDLFLDRLAQVTGVKPDLRSLRAARAVLAREEIAEKAWRAVVVGSVPTVLIVMPSALVVTWLLVSNTQHAVIVSVLAAVAFVPFWVVLIRGAWAWRRHGIRPPSFERGLVVTFLVISVAIFVVRITHPITVGFAIDVLLGVFSFFPGLCIGTLMYVWAYQDWRRKRAGRSSAK
jgi:hypothetical protein